MAARIAASTPDCARIARTRTRAWRESLRMAARYRPWAWRAWRWARVMARSARGASRAAVFETVAATSSPSADSRARSSRIVFSRRLSAVVTSRAAILPSSTSICSARAAWWAESLRAFLVFCLTFRPFGTHHSAKTCRMRGSMRTYPCMTSSPVVCAPRMCSPVLWPRALGGRARGDRLARVRSSPQWRDGRFRNRVRTATIPAGQIFETLRLQAAAGAGRYPSRPIPVIGSTLRELETSPATGLRVTWLGHASALVDVDGARILTDPVWGQRVSPLASVGPKRFFAPPVALESLPALDAVVISHDHYDHLEMSTIVALAKQGVPFFVPLGVGAHLER